MAKSLRSKSLRRNKAALRQKVFSPVEDARLNRLKEKDTVIVQETVNVEVKPQTKKPKRRRRNQEEKMPFNFYGLSKKDYAKRNKL